MWKEIGGMVLLLLAMVIFANLWFALVESVLGRIRRLFTRRREPPSWHPLPSEQEKEHLDRRQQNQK